MSDLTREARNLAAGGSHELASVYASIAQAEALERIADRLDSIVWSDDDRHGQLMVVVQR